MARNYATVCRAITITIYKNWFIFENVFIMSITVVVISIVDHIF